MSRPEASKLISKLRYNIKDRRNLKKVGSPEGRHRRIQQILTGLLKHERLELKYTEGDEVRGYVERLISDAIRNGDCHTPTMEMASYWITEKPLIHKLFKVLVPRYKDFNTISYTRMWRTQTYPGRGNPKCILELRNNIYPSLGPNKTNYKNLIHNILLSEAKKHFDKLKALKLENDICKSSSATVSSNPEATSEKKVENVVEKSSNEVDKPESTVFKSSFIHESVSGSKSSNNLKEQDNFKTLENSDFEKVEIKEDSEDKKNKT